MDSDEIARIEVASQEPMHPDESPEAYVDRIARTHSIGVDANDVLRNEAALQSFCEALEEQSGSTPETPTFADRVEASDDFRAAVTQSTELLTQNRRVLILLVILGILVLIAVIAGPYLW